MPTIDLEDTTLYYERTGRGPAILFVHGTFGRADNWAEQVPHLADRYTCVIYDRRGYTRSARGTAELSVARHADDAAGLIEVLDLAPCLVVGSSAGAEIAVDLALRHPQLLRGMVCSEPPLFSLDPPVGEAAMAAVGPRIEAAMAEGGPRAAVDAFMSLVCAEAWEGFAEDRRDQVRHNAEMGFADLEAPGLQVDADELATVQVPALIIAGTTSFPGPRLVARPLAAALADARLVVIDGGHLPYIEHPEEFAQAVSTFAGELDRRAVVAS